MTAFERTILVTGGAGFIGSNFIFGLERRRPEIRVIDLDLLTYAAHPQVWEAQKAMPGVVPVRGDICDTALVAPLLERFDVTGIIHFAAESHVDNSISNPQGFVRTNVLGTASLLTAAVRVWKKKGVLGSARFHHVSTDEVYGALGPEGFFVESTPYAPSSPYSASKASSDLLVRAFGRTYGLNYTISNCSNNFGPWQHAEKLIPTVIRKALAGEPVPIYGTGANVRDWLWVGDHCRAIESIFFDAAPGETFNVGGHGERGNLEMARSICALLDRLSPRPDGRPYAAQIAFVSDRPGHDFRYAIDPSKIERELGWRPGLTFEQALERTVRWYLGEGRALLSA